VGYFTTNPTKSVLHFSDFSMIFYAIYKKQQNHFTIGVTLSQLGPQKDSFLCNVAPGAAGRRGLGKFRRARHRHGRGMAGEGSKGCYGPIWFGFGSRGGRRRGVQRSVDG
jgi:hypothetical protein